MKNRTKRLLALLIASVTAVSALGCGASETVQNETPNKETSQISSSETANTVEDLYYNKDGFPIVKEPITIQMAGLREQTTDWQNTYVIQKIEEDMGIKINCTTYEDASVVSTQFATQMTSDTLPDLMINYTSVKKGMANTYGADGYLLDFADYLDIMPNLAKHMEENPEWTEFHTTDDGSIYSLGNCFPEPGPKYTIYVSKADQEKYGFSVEDIKTVEDFYEVLASIKEQNPDVIPFGWALGYWGSRQLDVVKMAYGIDGSLTKFNNRGIDDEGNVILHDITDNAKAYYNYMNMLWEEKLVDHEAFILTRDEFESKIRSGEYVFWYDSGSLQGTLKAEDGSCYEDYDQLVALTSEYNQVPTYLYGSPFADSSRIMVSAKTEYPEAICRLVDYMYSEEGRIFFRYGTEGETFDWVDNGLGTMVPSYDNYWDKSKYESAEDWHKQEIRICNAFEVTPDIDTTRPVNKASDEQLQAYITEDPTYTYTIYASIVQAIRAQAEEVVYPSYLTLPLVDEETDAISQLENDMKLLIEQYHAQFISGEADVDAEWDSYVKQISVFWDQIQPVLQGAYDRTNK